MLRSVAGRRSLARLQQRRRSGTSAEVAPDLLVSASLGWSADATPPTSQQQLVAALQAKELLDEPVAADIFLALDRAAFVARAHRARAYEDRPLPLNSEGAVISAPSAHARALQLAAQFLQERQQRSAMAAAPSAVRILDVGCGSGYQSAALALLAHSAAAGSSTLGVDVSPQLVERARSSVRGAAVQMASAAALSGRLGFGEWAEQLTSAAFLRFGAADALTGDGSLGEILNREENLKENLKDTNRNHLRFDLRFDLIVCGAAALEPPPGDIMGRVFLFSVGEPGACDGCVTRGRFGKEHLR